ncbi:DUF4363 family protein [Desulfotruncus alcoholivorax]|uniref:DUF4363 family protein n=1 Tax=Desulfotruncus alcoholivorax TaxID=265477 RepID=UPI000419DB09|nr:DUF4363 family protein [Desulfotruncus alcoholivorax]
MKIYVAVIAVLIVVLAFGVYTVNALESDTQQMMTGFGSLEKDIAAGNWDAAGKGMHQVQNKWSAHKSWWAMVIDHQEIDNIDMAIARVTKYIEQKDRTMASGEASVLKQMLEHIPEKEKINLKNIL